MLAKADEKVATNELSDIDNTEIEIDNTEIETTVFYYLCKNMLITLQFYQ